MELRRRNRTEGLTGQTERLKTTDEYFEDWRGNLAKTTTGEDLRTTGSRTGSRRIFQEYSTSRQEKTGLERAILAFSGIKLGLL